MRCQRVVELHYPCLGLFALIHDAAASTADHVQATPKVDPRSIPHAFRLVGASNEWPALGCTILPSGKNSTPRHTSMQAQKRSTTPTVLNGVFGSGKRGGLSLCQ